MSLNAHNAAPAGDSLTTLALNYEWREILAPALEYWFKHGQAAIDNGNEDKFEALIQDLYTFETFTMRLTKLVRKSIGSAFTTTSTVPVNVTNSDITHTFTYKNAVIRAFNVAMLNSGANSTIINVKVVGQVAVYDGYAESIGTTAREEQAVALYQNLPVGTVQTIRLLASVTAGTGTIGVSSIIVYEIEEWE